MSEPAAPVTTPYELLGGEAGVRRLVDRFYDIMDEAPEARGIRAMHAEDLGPMRQKLFEFMSGWHGGAPLFFPRKDAVCITRAHQPFAIGESERDQWLFCMHRALEDIGVDADLRRMLETPLFRIADFLRNQ